MKRALKCPYCRKWQKRGGGWEYQLAFKTYWKPPVGLQQDMREFKCSSCKTVFYQIMTPRELKGECVLPDEDGSTGKWTTQGELKGEEDGSIGDAVVS